LYKKIRVNKIRETCIEKYGVINPSCIDDVKAKKEETNIKHFGMHPRKTEEVKEKYRNTCLKRYNTYNTAKVKEVKQKIKEVFIEKYGGHPMFNEKVKEKVKNTWFERYGGSPMNTIIIKNKIRDTCNIKYGCHPTQTIEVQEKIQKIVKNINNIKCQVENFVTYKDMKTLQWINYLQNIQRNKLNQTVQRCHVFLIQ
jgi:hypothetical protein